MIIREAEFVLGVAQWSQLPDTGLPEIAFVGRSNVGKSSLLNMLVRRKALARTSGTPGKTQQFNYYLINQNFYFVDLPGYGYAKVSKAQRAKWGRFIGRYLTERRPLRLVIHLVDSRHPPTALDKDVMAWMKAGGVPYVIALTKTDKLSSNQLQKSKRATKNVLEDLTLEVPIVATSAQKKRGQAELFQWIETMLL